VWPDVFHIFHVSQESLTGWGEATETVLQTGPGKAETFMFLQVQVPQERTQVDLKWAGFFHLQLDPNSLQKLGVITRFFEAGVELHEKQIL